jgi:hypothetical protein
MAIGRREVLAKVWCDLINNSKGSHSGFLCGEQTKEARAEAGNV